MAIIQLRNNFTTCPEGVHIFRIYDVDYNEEFGRLVIKMVNAQGITVVQKYNFGTNEKPNEKAHNSFAFFAKAAFNNFNMDEVDPLTLVNRYIKAEVTHNVVPSIDDPNKTVTFINLGGKWAADGFDTTPTEKALTLGMTVTPSVTPTEPTTATKGVDLNSLLG